MPTCAVSRTTLRFFQQLTPFISPHAHSIDLCLVPGLGSDQKKIVEDWGRSRTWPEYLERGVAMKKKARGLVPGCFVSLSVVVGCLLGPLPQYVLAQTE